MTDRLDVHWFEGWESALDDALRALPVLRTCPHDLYRELCSAAGPLPKRTALVSRSGEPVAVIGLRQRSRHVWEPVTQWILPAAVCPARPGDIVPALASLGRELRVAWWRMGDLPTDQHIHHVEHTPVHRLVLSEREEFWRRTSRFKSIRGARRRCADLEVAVNDEGAAEWTIRNWERKWRVGEPDPALDDRLIAARHLQRAGLHHTVTISSGGRWVAGATNLADGDTLTAGVLYREAVGGNLPTGVRLVDAVLELAEAEGFRTFDMGGGQDYKESWAPQDGYRQQFVVSPSWLRYRRSTVEAVRSAVGRLRRPAPAGAAHRDPAAAPTERAPVRT